MTTTKALQDLHVQLITLLTADDAKASKAYRLGFAMSETALRPIRYGEDQYPEVFQRYRLGVVSRRQGIVRAHRDSLVGPYFARRRCLACPERACWFGR